MSGSLSKSLAAYCTYCIVYAICCAGVTGCIDCFLCNENLVTYGTMLTCGKTGLGTSGSLSCVSYLGMTERVGMTINVAMTAYCTSVSGVTAIFTIGSSYYRLVGVTKRVYGLLRNENLVTYGTMLTCGKTCLGTSRSLSCVSYLSVTESYLLIIGSIITS